MQGVSIQRLLSLGEMHVRCIYAMEWLKIEMFRLRYNVQSDRYYLRPVVKGFQIVPVRVFLRYIQIATQVFFSIMGAYINYEYKI